MDFELCSISMEPYDECDGLHEGKCVWLCGQCGGNVYNCICPNTTIPEFALDPRVNGAVEQMPGSADHWHRVSSNFKKWFRRFFNICPDCDKPLWWKPSSHKGCIPF